MAEIYNNNLKYNHMFNRIQKRFSTYECLLIIKKLYFTDKTFYYFLCVLFRFIPLIILSGDFSSAVNKKNNTKSFHQYLKIFTCHSIIGFFNLFYKIYILIFIIILIILIILSIMNIFILIKFNNYYLTNKWYLPSKFKIIIEHIIFLLFPFIIEYLSFTYYIYF